MLPANGYSNGYTTEEGHYKPVIVVNPPEAVVEDSKRFIGMISNHHRGYMKAFHYLCALYMLEYAMPPNTLNVWSLLNKVDLTEAERVHLLNLFSQKVNGVKDAPFCLSFSDVYFKYLFVCEAPDYNYVFHKLLEV